MQASETRLRRALAAMVLAGGLGSASAAPIFAPDGSVHGWANRPTLTSNDLKSDQEVVFRAEFRATDWGGGLYAQYINDAGDISDLSPWSTLNAATILDAQHWDTGRRIVTRSHTGVAIPFRKNTLSNPQMKALEPDDDKVVEYVRGRRDEEDPSGKKWRKRSTVLGHIQHSTLLHWKYPRPNPDTPGPARLFVGANDGMLHVFDAANGSEVFAYIPSMFVLDPAVTGDPKSTSPLRKLLTKTTDAGYKPPLYVDGGLAIGEVKIGTAWRTLLAGALGGGGRGLFMLDVTDPHAATETAAAEKIKWEITPKSTGFANLGYTYAAPRLTRLDNGPKPDGTKGDGIAALIVGNGYVNTGTRRASLYVIDADTGALIREIDTAVAGNDGPNGLSTPTLVDVDGDDRVDFAYAGDIDGKLWKFDLRHTTAAGYTAEPTLLYTTEPAQPITVAPVIYPHPLGGRMVLFGTGRILTAGDKSDPAAHAAYGIWDGAPAANTTLLAQTLNEETFNGEKLRWASSNLPDWRSGHHRGWRLALSAGERIVGDSPFLDDNRLFFVTMNPTVPAAAAGLPTGMNWMLQVDPLTGGSLGRSVFDINGDGFLNDADKTNGQFVNGWQVGAGVASQPVLVDMVNFSQTLFNLVSDVGATAPAPTSDPGVAGGHFDLDIYYGNGVSGNGFTKKSHTHEYDDRYNVTGVNYLAPSADAYKLSNAIPSTSTAFRILVVNQYLNPASKLSVGGSAFVDVKNYGLLASASNADTLLASLPLYTRNNITTMMWALPSDGFAAKDWWGDGGTPRAGLIPTSTGCVNGVRVSTSGATMGTPGPNGEIHNGALTLQLIRHDTPATALELNRPGFPSYGWRVKGAQVSTYLLASYTMFWHARVGCYGSSGWIPNPPLEAGAPSKKTPVRPAGSADPTGGAFGSTTSLPSGVTVTSVTTTISGNTTTVTTTFSDGKTSKVITSTNGDGTETVVIIDREGNRGEYTRIVGSTLVNGTNEVLVTSRRITWREVVRP
jgi:hypothetical protein